MAQATATETKTLLTSLIPIFHAVETNSSAYRESLEAICSWCCDLPSQNSIAISFDKGPRQDVFHRLALCLNETRLLKSDHHVQALCILADASREKKWRSDLASCQSRSSQPGWPPDPNHASHGYSHQEWLIKEAECVLHIAVRTLHPRYVGNSGQAAYQAIRLISNCCADSDANKKVVLECGGMELLLRCVHSRLWPDAALVALWNICADCDEDAHFEGSKLMGVGDGTAKQQGVAPAQMSTIATTQLCLRSKGECEDHRESGCLDPANLYWPEDANIISDLLQLASVVTDRARKEMAAELLEKASWSLSTSLSPANIKEQYPTIPEEARLIRYDIRPENFLFDLLEGPGPILAMSYPDCNRDVIQSIAMLVSQTDVQREMIDQELVKAFFTIPNWEPIEAECEQTVHSDTSRVKIQQSISKIMYDVTGCPSFAAKYSSNKKSSELVLECLDALKDMPNAQRKTHTIPPAAACLTLANLITSREDALFFVQRKEIHSSLNLVLRQQLDSTVLFPAMALLDRLAIPADNKPLLFTSGITRHLPKIFNNFDVQPRIQREAVTALRKIIEGSLDYVSDIGICGRGSEEEPPGDASMKRFEEESCLQAALQLFHRTTDPEIKIEVSRLVVEVCRTIFHSAGGHPEQAEDDVRLILGKATSISDPLVFIVREAPTKALQGEGWFSLAILSTWVYGRSLVVECLADQAVQEKVELAFREHEEAFCQNIGLMLTKLRLLPGHGVDPSTRGFLERVARIAGLPSIWPEMDTAARHPAT